MSMMPTPHRCTYWAPGAPDGYGGSGWAAPILVPCRWQASQRLVRNAAGDEVMSVATIYTHAPVALNGRLMYGVVIGLPTPPSESQLVLAVEQAVDLDGSTDHWKVAV
jgi:hypothetical protein